MGTGVLFSFLQYKLCIGPLRSLDSTFQYFPFHCWRILLSSALDVHTCQSKYMGAFDSSVTQVYGSCTGIWEQYIRQGPGGFEAGAQSLYSWSTHQLMRGAPSLHCTVHHLAFLCSGHCNVLKCFLQTRCVAARGGRPLHTYPAPLSLSVPSLDASPSRAIPMPPPLPPFLAMHLHLPLKLHLH